MGINTGLLMIRLAVGFTFFYHGAQKLFGVVWWIWAGKNRRHYGEHGIFSRQT